jgi:hypothetical protein
MRIWPAVCLIVYLGGLFGMQTAAAQLNTSEAEVQSIKYIVSLDEQDFKEDTIVNSTPLISVLSAVGIYEIKEIEILVDGVPVSLKNEQRLVDDQGRDKVAIKLISKEALSAGRHEIEILVLDWQDQKSIYQAKDILVFTGPPQIYGKVEVTPKDFDPHQSEVVFVNYKLTRSSDVEFYLYAVNGELILRRFYAANEDGGRAGVNSLIWDGRREDAEIVFPGDYFFRLIAVDGKMKSVLGKGMVKTREGEKKS